ncbi:MAG: exported protein of unknown function [Candidatus Saccharibacteria bacterium]|nr:exported protein of unknown function [Candidatus Saccharibacteria bacterium]
MKLFNKIRSAGRKSKFAVVVLALAVGVGVPLAHAEFYPDRPTYDYNKFDPNNLNCDDAANPAAQNGRCGSMNGPVFNSFVNTPSYGDERAFFDGRRSDMAANTNADDIQNVNDGSKEVVLRMYVHNNANTYTNASGQGVAHNTKVRIALPTATEQVLRARAYISADNAGLVEDTADLLGSEKFNVTYVPGSAKLLRGTSQYALSDSIVGSGAQVGNNTMNGDLPGCFEFAALVEIHVKVNVEQKPQLQLVKEVKVKGTAGWGKEVTTKPGTEVQWRLGTKDVGNVNLDNVVIRDILPPHVKLVPGSVRLINTAGDKVQADGPLFAGGFIAGNYVPGGTQYVIFNTTTLDDFSTCEVRVRNIALARSDQTPTEVRDTSDVVIQKENCKPQPPTPAYSCDMLTATKGDNRTVTYTTAATATNGAKVTLYHYDFGDNSAVLVTDKATVSHAYAKDGQYAARVKVQFAVNNTVKYAENDKCAAVVTFTAPGVPTAPTQLVNTGPGSVAAIFAVVTALGAVVYRWYLGRRLSA